jgi:putative hydrolases of HD superfamily
VDSAETTAIVNLLHEVGILKRVRRSGWWVAGVDDPESVAEHSHRTAVIGLLLADLEGADPLRTLVMCVCHDIAEARVNDAHRIQKRYLPDWGGAEFDAYTEQISQLPDRLRTRLADAMAEWEAGDTIEAKVAHDADAIECLLQAREYESQGYEDVTDWIHSSRRSLVTESGQAIGDGILEASPARWWAGLKKNKK